MFNLKAFMYTIYYATFIDSTSFETQSKSKLASLAVLLFGI